MVSNCTKYGNTPSGLSSPQRRTICVANSLPSSTKIEEIPDTPTKTFNSRAPPNVITQVRALVAGLSMEEKEKFFMATESKGF